MFLKKFPFIFYLLIFAKVSFAQVPIPVREEPRHHRSLQNNYIRLLDVWLPPGDTTLFHIHEIPSLFVTLSATKTESQVKGENWVQGTFTFMPGHVWYNDFKNGPLIHRVLNNDSIPFHAMDIEILSNYDKDINHLSSLPFDTLFTNEKAFAYRVNLSNKDDKKLIENRGPIVVIVVSGPGISVHFNDNKKPQEISQGKYVWIEPGTKCWFQNNRTDETLIVIFELK
ncbi:MAG TPA: hypothetical protein VN958_17785 [Chitinophagaceae bacterium]|nr:hypothetical protein [Chitinophagaceae bacterium]